MIRRRLAALALGLMLALAVHPAGAQDAGLASLVADAISVDPSGRVTASGNVVVYYQGTRLSAASVSYERRGDQLTIEGPITVTSPDGDVLTADAATLDRTLRDGVLRSARLVLDQQLQLAAAEIARSQGRYTTLDRVAASSCTVCAGDPTPLWEIRADRVIHDKLDRQLYFENARLRVAGVPIFFIPRLRLPDPTLDRATGFLIPRLRSTSGLGTGVKLPYFIAIGDHADVTLTPYLSTSTTTVELRYRQEILNGSISVEGAATNDDVEGRRGYLFADAKYRLPREFVLDVQLEFVSDPGYLFRYDYANKDRLTNEVALSRVRDKDLLRAGITEFRTLRESEIPIRDTLPDRFIEVGYIRDMPQLSFGGGATTLRVDSAALNRPSSADVDGRDVSRVGVGLDWARSDVLGPGIVARTELGIRADAYNVGQDVSFETNFVRTVPRAAAELRWPLARAGRDGASDVIEPVLRLDISNTGGQDAPIEDSIVVEFDEANLFSATRYPGIDGVEDGTRVAAGLSWRHVAAEGWSTDIAVGRIFGLDGSLGLIGSGLLDGDRSEWLLAGRIGLDDRLWLASRSLLDDNFAFTLSETRLDWAGDGAEISSSYIFAEAEPAEGRDDRLQEWSFRGAVALTDTWTLGANWRYDFTAGREARTGLELDYTNECMRLDLSLSRRYANSTSVTPTTDFGFRVSLLGVGNATAGARRVCKG